MAMQYINNYINTSNFKPFYLIGILNTKKIYNSYVYFYIKIYYVRLYKLKIKIRIYFYFYIYLYLFKGLCLQ